MIHVQEVIRIILSIFLFHPIIYCCYLFKKGNVNQVPSMWHETYETKNQQVVEPYMWHQILRTVAKHLYSALLDI
ncbi:hypothetical protein VNO78_11313 [Psophocarpus tetragonolobus]|uniref:Uncharacterized protein n=1 Tax=Psophocarpus tetragonolobus TaxID=3891 RepID=A0AAN9SM67_PSOTE